MKTRRIASLLIACGLLAPAPFARAEEEAKKEEPKTEKTQDTSDAQQAKDPAPKDSAPKDPAPTDPAPTDPTTKDPAPKDPQQDALQTAALDVRSTELFDKKNYEGALPLLTLLAKKLDGETEKFKAVKEKIAVAEKALKDAGKDPVEIAARGLDSAFAQAPAAVGPPSDEQRKPHAKPKGGEPYAVTIQELGNFQFDQEKGGNIPKDVQALSGATVRLSGYMIPLDQADKIRQFVLVPDLFACCFGQPPQVQHSIIVNCPDGKAVNYFPDQIVVEGTLKVEEKKDDGYIVSLFELACKSVKPAPK